MSETGPMPSEPQPQPAPQYQAPQYPAPAQDQPAQAPYAGQAYPGQAYPGQAPYAGQPAYAPVQYASPKNLLVASLLCFFLGVLGIHRFYVGKVGTGILQIVTLGGLGIWTLIDLIMLVCQAFKDSDGYTLRWDAVH